MKNLKTLVHSLGALVLPVLLGLMVSLPLTGCGEKAPTQAATPTPVGGGKGKITYIGPNFKVWTMNADGSHQTQLSNSGGSCLGPKWSPNGKKILFSQVVNGVIDLYTMDPNGSNETQITAYPYGYTAYQGAWSPDGTKIAFAGNTAGNYNIIVIDADGSSPVTLTSDAGDDNYPCWSPDGTKIYFGTFRNSDQEIYVMDSDGIVETNITNSPGIDNQPSVSPQGDRVAFISSRDGNSEIYEMYPNGFTQTRMTNNAANDDTPFWSPDGNWLGFSTNRDGDQELVYIDSRVVDQVFPTQWTVDTDTDLSGDWR